MAGAMSINVDISRALNACNDMRGNMNDAVFRKCLEATIRDTGNRAVRKIVKQKVLEDYAVTAGWVNKKIMHARFTGGGASFGCVVPIKGERGTIGGIFSAGGAGRAKGRARAGREMKRLKKGGGAVTAKILKGKSSGLPGRMTHQGGNAPFRLPNGVVVTRKTSSSLPVVRIAGRAVPQMVDRHFMDKMEQPLNDYMIKRMQENIARFMKI